MNKLTENNGSTEKKVIDISIKMIIVLLLVTWCALILFPFVTVLLWSIILSITLFPLFDGLTRILKGKKTLSAIIVSLGMLLVLLVPFVLLLTSVFEEAKLLGDAIRNNTLVVPPPNPKVADWPLVGTKLYEAWKALNENLESTILQYKDQIREVGGKIIRSLMSVASNVLMFSASIIIAGVFMATSPKGEKSSLQLSNKLIGSMGAEFLSTIVGTIRNVAKGIIGVAFIQFALTGIVFLLAGVPFAGIWAIMVFVLALVQLPSTIVVLPVIIFIYSIKDPFPATMWAVALFLVGISDNILKPWLMGKGAPVPMLVIFLGAIGGFILSGFIGLFTGAIILSLGYKLGGLWLDSEASEKKTN